MRKWLKSSVWVHGEYGIKEAEAAKFIRQGRPILLVYDSDFRGLLQDKTPARVADRVAGQPFVWLAPVTKRQFHKAAMIAGALDREHTVLGRVEQSYLRHVLFGAADEAACSLCGRRLPVGLLVAAHLKARSATGCSSQPPAPTARDSRRRVVPTCGSTVDFPPPPATDTCFRVRESADLLLAAPSLTNR